jgi:hypothetical protein
MSDSKLMGYSVDGWGLILAGTEISVFTTLSRKVLRPPKLPLQWVAGCLSPVV